MKSPEGHFKRFAVEWNPAFCASIAGFVRNEFHSFLLVYFRWLAVKKAVASFRKTISSCCRNTEGVLLRGQCGFVICKKFFERARKLLTNEMIIILIKNGKISVKGFYSEKSGKNYGKIVDLAQFTQINTMEKEALWCFLLY